MILLIEIGNSTVKWALLKLAKTKLKSIDYGTSHCYVEQDYEQLFTTLWGQLASPHQIWVASVADKAIETALTQWIETTWNLPIKFIKATTRFKKLKNGYQVPQQLGIDRWLNMIAAWEEFKTAVCVIDCGTAITIDGIDSEGKHSGGLIVPGVTMMREVLINKTAKCVIKDQDKLAEENGLLARNTTQGIIGGSIYTVVAFIEQIIHDLTQEWNEEVNIIITGGDGDMIKTFLTRKVFSRPALSLDGLALYVAAQQLKLAKKLASA